MTTRILAQAAAEALSTAIPGPEAAEMRAEVLTHVTPQAELAALVHEYVASVQPQAKLAQALVECLAAVQPSAEVAHLLLEILSTRDPSVRADAIYLSELLVEMLRSSAGAGAGGSVQRDVFAFRHNWAEPLVERLEWQTRVARTTSGLEAREANRIQPRRSLTYRVGTGRTCDALVADWLTEHMGKPAWWPLPQYAARLTLAAETGATALQTSGIDAHHFGPPAAQWLFDNSGMQGWQGTERHALLIGPAGWHTVRIQAIAGDTVQLTDSLPGAAPAGSSLMPLLWGRASEPVNLTQLLPGVAAGSVTAQFDPAPAPDQGALDDPLLDGIPVWPDGDWSSDPRASVAASVTQHDFSPAQPWTRRDDPWTLSTLQRRYMATSSAAIDAWRARLWRVQGRLNAFWASDGLAPVLRLTQPYQPEDGWLSVDAGQATDFWRRPAACLILLPDGQRLHALTGALENEAGGTLMLRSTLDEAIPVGSRVIRLMRCRLDHDAVDLHWHAPQLVEIALTLRQLPEAQSVAPIDWPKVIATPPMVWPMTLRAPPRPPQFQCPPPTRVKNRMVFYAQDMDAWGARAIPQDWYVPAGVNEIFITACAPGGHGWYGGRALTAIRDLHPVGGPVDPRMVIKGAPGGGGGGAGAAMVNERLAVPPLSRIRLFVPKSFRNIIIRAHEPRSTGDLYIDYSFGQIHLQCGLSSGSAFYHLHPNMESFALGGEGGSYNGRVSGSGKNGNPRNGALGGEGGDGAMSPLPEFAGAVENGGGTAGMVHGHGNFSSGLDGGAGPTPGSGGGGGGGASVVGNPIRDSDGTVNPRRVVVAPLGYLTTSTAQPAHAISDPYSPNPGSLGGIGGPGIVIIEWFEPIPPEVHPL